MSAKRLLVVMNPRSGGRRGPSVLEQVRPVFAAGSFAIDSVVTESPGHAREIAQSRSLEDYDGMCLVGGDGTLHEVVNGLMERAEPLAVPLGLIPGGTGNSVSAHLGFEDPSDAARRIVRGNTRSFDVLHVSTGQEHLHCVNIIGWGAAVDINRTAERLRFLGAPRYTLAALSHILRARRRYAKVHLDGVTIEDKFLMAIGCNTKFTGKGMQIAPRAELGDGFIDVVVVRKATRWQMLRMFTKVFDGSHVALPFVEYHQVRSFGIESDTADLLNLDGELKSTTPVSVQVLPAALRMFA